MASHFQVVFLLCFTGGLLSEAALTVRARGRRSEDQRSSSVDVKVPVPGCPPGWTVFGSRCFKFQADDKDMAEAEVTCISLGGNLASIHSPEEHEFVRGLIRKESGSDSVTWIGGYDSMKESTWLWTDGLKFDYKAWCAGEPNNYGKQPENCAETNFRGQPCWNDHPCSLKRPFVCAKPLGLTVSVNISTD